MVSREDESPDGSQCLMRIMVIVYETQNVATRNASGSKPMKLPLYDHFVGAKSTVKAGVIQPLGTDATVKYIYEVVPLIAKFRE